MGIGICWSRTLTIFAPSEAVTISSAGMQSKAEQHSVGYQE